MTLNRDVYNALAKETLYLNPDNKDPVDKFLLSSKESMTILGEIVSKVKSLEYTDDKNSTFCIMDFLMVSI